MNNDEKRSLSCALLLFGVPALLAVSLVLRGWALRALWGWFIVPLGVPAIGMVQAIGISGLVAFLTYEGDTRKVSESDWSRVIGQAIIQPVFTVAFLALVRWVAS